MDLNSFEPHLLLHVILYILIIVHFIHNKVYNLSGLLQTFNH